MNPRFRFWFMKQGGPDWERLHQLGNQPEFFLSASTLPKLLGFQKGYSAAMIYDFYKGNKVETKPDDFVQTMLDWGNQIEFPTIQLFLKDNPGFVGVKPGTLTHSKHLWLGASFDHILVNKVSGELWNLEVKGQYMSQEITCPEEIQDKYYCQIQTQMLIAPEITGSILLCKHQNNTVPYRAFLIPRNPEYINLLEKACVAFKRWVCGEVTPDESLKWRFGYFKKNFSDPLLKLQIKAVKEDNLIMLL
jgi:hypothetical protein